VSILYPITDTFNVTFKSGSESFKIIEIAPFDRSHTSYYSSSIVTMVVSCIVSEIKQILVENANFSYRLPFNFHDYLEPRLNFFPKY